MRLYEGKDKSISKKEDGHMLVHSIQSSREVKVHVNDVNYSGIPNLKHDYSVMIDENGTQVQRVGNHWRLLQALDNESRAKLDRSGACLSCHKEMPNEDLAVSLLVHTAKFAGMKVDNEMHKNIVNKSILLSAWVQVLAGLVLGGILVYLYMRRRRNKR